MIAAALLLGAKALFGYQSLSKQGHDDFKYRSEQNMLPSNLTDESDYVDAYKRAHGPAGTLHIAGALLSAALLTYPLLGALVFIFEHGWRAAGQPRAYEPGYLVWQFMLFAGVIIFYAFIAWLTARLYYRKEPRRIDARRKLGG